MYNSVSACFYKVINEVDEHRKKDIDEMRWLLIDDDDDVWIVCDFNIQYFIVSVWESYNFLDCNLPLLIYICMYRLTMIFGQECLAVDLSVLHLIWYVWYDMICYFAWRYNI